MVNPGLITPYGRMKKRLSLIAGIIIGAFISFFEPLRIGFSFNLVTVVQFVTIVFLSLLVYRKSEDVSKVTLLKKDYFVIAVFAFCLTLGYGLLTTDGYDMFDKLPYTLRMTQNGFDVFYGSVYAVLFTAASYVYYFVFSVYLLKYLYRITSVWLESGTDVNLQCKNRFVSYIYDSIRQNNLKFYFAVFLIAWLPCFIIYFPGIIIYDTIFELEQYYGIPNPHTDAVLLIDPSQTLTGHHGVVHPVMLGWFSDIGKLLFNSADMGLFLYTLIQYIVMVLVVAYMFKSLQRYLGVKWTFLFMMLFVFHPFYSTCTILMTKDIYFCAFFILYLLMYYDMVRSPAKLRNVGFILRFFLVTVGMLLFRNNALYTILLISIVLLVFLKPKKFILGYLVAVLVFNTVFNSILMPFFSIPAGSPREALSVPFQQTAYYVNKYEPEVTSEEKEAISKILDYDNMMENFNPDTSDPIKDTFNKYSTDKDLKEYFAVWFKMFLKHPVSYVEAFLGLNYGYYFPSAKDSVTYHCFNDYMARNRGAREGLDISPSKELNAFKLIHSYIYIFIGTTPIVCMFNDTGIFVWVWIFLGLYIISKFGKDKKKYLLYMVPYFAYMIFILLGPMNGTMYVRYVIPFVYAMPLMFLPLFEYKYNLAKSYDE